MGPEFDEATRRAKEDKDWAMAQYDSLVEYLYVAGLRYNLKLYAAMFLFVMYLLVQGLIVIMELTWGIHSKITQNSQLENHYLGGGRKGYEPKPVDEAFKK